MSTTEIPGYKIIRTLGVGGQATVYLAIQKGFDREIALKVMSPALAADPTFGERFIREAKIVAKLSHKSIVTVYDVGESGSFYYLAMEYLAGSDLKTRINQGIKTRECLSIIAKLATALDFAHSKGYIHRDVKSENILFDEDGEPVLTDFGIAKASNSSTQMTQTGKLIGTPEYMSPEQCRGKNVDGRSDLYSLGIIFYEMLTRQVPYTGEDSVAVCIKHVTKPSPQLPVRLKHYQWLLDSLLAKEPDKRFQTGKQLAQSLFDFEKTGKQRKTTGTSISSDTSNQASRAATEVFAMEEDSDNFDDLHTERRFSRAEEPNKSNLAKIVFVILLLVLVIGGYLSKGYWFEESYRWAQIHILGKKPDSELSGTDNTGTLSNEPTNVGEREKPTTQNLLREADALIQFVPHRIEDIKKSLVLVATVKTLEPGNKNAELIYQNILSTSLMEATAFAEKADFKKAEEWIALVEYEAPDYSLLGATRQNVMQLQQNYEASNSVRVGNEEQLAKLLSAGNQALLQNRLSSPQDDNAITYFQQVLDSDPANTEAKQGLLKVADAYEVLIESAIKERTFAKAKTFLSRFSSLSDDPNKLSLLRQKIKSQETRYAVVLNEQRARAEKAELLRKAEAERAAKLNDPIVQMRLLGSLDSARQLEEQGYLVVPETNNALEKYKGALEIDNANQEALDGMKRIEKRIIEELSRAIEISDVENAEQWLTHLKLYRDDHTQFDSFSNQLEVIKQERSLQAKQPEELIDLPQQQVPQQEIPQQGINEQDLKSDKPKPPLDDNLQRATDEEIIEQANTEADSLQFY